MKQLSEILQFVTYSETVNFIDCTINGIYYDSREVIPTSLFVAIQGEKVSGDTFIAMAIERGATVIVTEQNVHVPDSVILIVVEDARKALAEISNAFYDFPSKILTLVGITGTNGKTTCSFLLKELLTFAGKNVGVIGTTGIYFADKVIAATHTTPESPKICSLLVEMMEYGIDTVIMEVSSHSLILNRVYGLHFTAVMFTNLSQDHLDFHKTMLNYATAKKMLFDMVGEKSVAVLFSSDEWAEFMIQDCSASTKVLVGREIKNSTNVLTSLISNETSTLEGISFDLEYLHQSTSINSTSLVGKFNGENLSISLIVATILTNIPLQFFATACKSITAAPGRMESILLQKRVRAFVDYAHTPDALEKVLLTAKQNISNGKLIVVFGCGGNRDVTKRPLMGEIASSIADVVIITNDNPREEEPRTIIQDIIAGISKDIHNYSVIENRADAIKYAVECSNQGDCIVIAGKGHENYQIVGTNKTHFSDQEELLKYQ